MRQSKGKTEEAINPGRKQVFLLALNDFHRAKLATITGADRYQFHGLLDEPAHYDVPDMLRRAETELSAFPGRIDAVVGYMDFPISTMLPILCGTFGLRSPSLESILRCEHKYWARVLEREIVPEHIPRFTAVDPFDDAALDKLDLDFPFWLKPIKSCGSYLGFRIHDEGEFIRAIARIRAEIAKLAGPFNFVLDHVTLPPEIAAVDGHHCIAEEIIGGRQCTLEGYALDGEFGYHGVVDSIRERNRSSFARYEYPSQLPRSVQERMAAIAAKVLAYAGFDNSGFNIEFFWERRRDHIWLLEINTRVAQHHSDLFERVDGTSNLEVPIRIALGQEPRIERGGGNVRHAATFFLRAYADATVARVPDECDLAAIEARFPGTVVHAQVQEGMRLSDLHEQDSYSYALAIVYMAANSRARLLANWHECAEQLRAAFRLVP